MSAHSHPLPLAQVASERDPVCGMTVKSSTPHRAVHEGRTYLFCSAGCKAKFEADPARYLSVGPAPDAHSHHAPVNAAADAHAKHMQPALAGNPQAAGEWTCPMHP